MTCPRCEQGDLFVSPMTLSNPLKMNKQCSICGQKFEPEPGFYYGAMFISYIFLGFFSLGLTGLLVFYFRISFDIAFSILLLTLALMFIWNLRFSRSIWIHLVVKFDPGAARIEGKETRKKEG